MAGQWVVTETTIVNGESFAGLNCCISCGFQGYRESFPVNIIQASYDGTV